MNRPIDGMELGKVLCEMFGINPSNVIGLEVKAYINELAKVEVITRPEWADGYTVSRKFKLVDDK